MIDRWLPFHADAVFSVLGIVLATSWAKAQESEPPVQQPPSAPPDYVPPGPPIQRPAFVPDAPTPGSVQARFEPDEAGLQLLALTAEVPFPRVAYVRHGWWHPHGYYMGMGLAHVYAPLCDGPCNVQLMRGPVHLALSKEGRAPVAIEDSPTWVRGPATLKAHYVDRSGTRTAGGVVGIVGTVGGLVMILSSFHEHRGCDAYGVCYQRDDVNGPLLASGLGVFFGSAIASAIMIWQRDEARLTLTPLYVSNSNRARRDSKPQLASRGLPGAALTLSF